MGGAADGSGRIGANGLNLVGVGRPRAGRGERERVEREGEDGGVVERGGRVEGAVEDMR